MLINSKITMLICGLIVFVISFCGAMNLQMVHAPDEYMRYQIPQWIFEHNALPVGNELELRNPSWGFSYGFTPYLPQLVSVIFMKIASLFTNESIYILIAARLTSVLCYTFTFIFTFLIGKELFSDTISALLLSVLLITIPQVYFLSLYINNDSPALCFDIVLIHSLIIGHKNSWNLKSSFYVAVASSLLLLTYYNHFVVLLCGGIFYLYSIYCNKLTLKQIFISSTCLIFTVFLLSSWFYIRNAYLHNGDFLGLKTMKELSNMYAIDELKSVNINNGLNTNASFYQYFINGSYGNWFSNTFHSLIGVFGYMKYPIPQIAFNFYLSYFLITCAAGVWFLFKSTAKKLTKVIILICFMLCFTIPILLSMYNSYFSNYQAQGRYILASLLPVIILSVYGLKNIANFCNSKFSYLSNNFIVIFVILIFSILSIFLIKNYLYINCFGNTIL